MRNFFNTLVAPISSKKKYYLVRLIKSGHNTAAKSIIFSGSRKNTEFSSILLPVSRFNYSNFSYRYFFLKWNKFEKKSQYLRYFKTPAAFPEFIGHDTFFDNLVFKKRKFRWSKNFLKNTVFFTGRPLKNSFVALRSFRLRKISFFSRRKRKVVNYSFYKKLLFRKLKIRKTFRFAYPRVWGYYKSKKFKNFYFKRRGLRFKLLKYVNFKKSYRTIYAKRYSLRKLIFRRKGRKVKSVFSAFFKTLSSSNRSFKRFRKYKKKKRRWFRRFFRRIKRRARRQYYRLIKRKFILRDSYFNYNFFRSYKFTDIKNFLLGKYSLLPYLSSHKVPAFYPKVPFQYVRSYSIFKNFKFFWSKKDFVDVNKKQILPPFVFVPFLFSRFHLKPTSLKFSAIQHIQRRKFSRNLRFAFYTKFFIRAHVFKRSTKNYKLLICKLLRLFYRSSANGQVFSFLPVVLGKFFYFGLSSHFQSNLYFRDYQKSNNFSYFSNKKANFVVHNRY